MNKVSIIVPCFNEEVNINNFWKETTNILNKNNIEYEIIFVDDGSEDETYLLIEKICNNNKNAKGINFSRNFGKDAAILAGMKEAIGEYIVIIDADLQQNPKYIIDMYKILEENKMFDIVTSYQEKRKEKLVLKTLKKLFYSIINKISDIDFVQGASDFRMMRRNVMSAILELSEYNRFSKGIFNWVGFNNYYMKYDVEERKSGSSKWSFFKLFKYGIDGIVSFSVMPLKIATIIGIISAVSSFLYLIVVIIQKIFLGIDIPGYATTIVLILLMGGLQLFSSGIIGEYLSKTYLETKRRPKYIIKNKTDEKR